MRQEMDITQAQKIELSHEKKFQAISRISGCLKLEFFWEEERLESSMIHSANPQLNRQ